MTSGAGLMDHDRLLRRLRAHPALFGDDVPQSARVTRLILRCKAQLILEWDARAERFRQEADRRFWFLTL